MIELGYPFILETYNSFMKSDGVFFTIVGLKGLSVAFSIIYFLMKYLKYLDQKKIGSSSEDVSPISAYDIFKVIAYVVLVSSFDYVLDFIDFMFAPLNSYEAFRSTVVPLSPDIIKPIDQEVTNMSVTQLLGSLNEQFWILLHPNNWLVEIASWFSWLLDQFIFTWFLGQRFFIIGILRLLGPVAAVFLIFEPTRKYFITWGSMLLAQYFLIVPYFAVIAFVNFIYDRLLVFGAFSSYGILAGVAAIFVVFFKISLFSMSKNFVVKLFS